MTANIPAQLLKALAPSGKLRASINLGNPILANRDPSSGVPVGISVDLARAFAERLGVEMEMVVFDAAGKSVEAVKNEQADIGFFAIDPLRGEGIAFTQAYVVIEGCYLVRNDSRLQSNEEVDRSGIRVVVGMGSAYDLYLSRTLKAAQLLRAPTSPSVVDMFVTQNLEVAAGVKQQLQADMKRHDGLRLLPGRFMDIQQAMGTPKSRGSDAHAFLSQFVEDMKANGFVAASIQRHGTL
ncbi:MAG: ABC transporter substrate-binding protein [Betaproteobacteria bacterium]|nr:ABC transporter substrate-binding protein [Betaproteobacteria bacterium]NBY71994.1 ABC transporter substrate-binding protein [Betaproteobacteria bacterium]